MTEERTEDRHTVLDPRASNPGKARYLISCTWADDTTLTNMFEGIHYCPFCGWVVEVGKEKGS